MVVAAQPRVQRLLLTNFADGLNLRDSPNELALSETPDALNWTLDQRGALKWRKGSLNVADLPGTTQQPRFIKFSAALNQWLCIAIVGGALKLFTRPADFSSTWTDRGQVNASIAGVGGFIDFPGNPPKVVLSTGFLTGPLSFAGGIYTWDGTTLAQVAAAFTGSSVKLWKNRVWVAGYFTNDANGNPTRVFYSKIGDPTNWAAPDGGFVDIRDKDAELVTALGIAGGALIVFKRTSAYRVVDPVTGDYSLIDPSNGCVGPQAIAEANGRIYTWGADGAYEWDGIGAGRNIGDRVRQLFTVDPGTVGGEPRTCAGVTEGRIIFAYPTVAGGDLNRILEYDPQSRWVMRHQLANITGPASSFPQSFASKRNELYAALRHDRVLKVFSQTAGADDGTVTANNFRTPWLQPNGGRFCRILKAQVEGLLVAGGTNTLKLRCYKDWDLSSFDEYDLTADLRAGDANDQQKSAIVQQLGHGQSFAFELVAGAAAGDAAVRLLALDWVPLER